MKVKEIIMRALTFAGRDDVSKALEADIELEGEMSDAVRTALLCFNAVEDELARCYLPVKKSQTFNTANGEIEFTAFSERPVKILSVRNSAGKCDYELFHEKMKTCAGKVVVEYNFSPQPKDLNGDSLYSESQASVSLIAAGTASEFCLIAGDACAANVWETRYRREIDAVQRKKYSGAKIPPRRWV